MVKIKMFDEEMFAKDFQDTIKLVLINYLIESKDQLNVYIKISTSC